MASRSFSAQLIGNAQDEAPEGIVGKRVIGLFHRVLAETAGESEHAKRENEEDKIGGVVSAAMAAIAIGAEAHPEKLNLHPYPRENSYEAESCRHGDDGIVRLPRDNAKLIAEIGERNAITQAGDQRHLVRSKLIVKAIPPAHTQGYAVGC